MSAVIVVLDIGKTNVKATALCLDSARSLEIVRRPNAVVDSGPYPHADVDGIWIWFKQQLAKFSQRFDVKYITCTTHGATAACLSGEELCLPVLDYEDSNCEALSREYDEFRPSFNETGSPQMGFGLNLGRQLFWLSRAFKETFERCDTVLAYPQYWCWLLSGTKASEVTSLGCHTDLWSPRAKSFSTLVEKLEWTQLFPEIRPAGDNLGPVREELAAELGLGHDCYVLNGIHDSNASLVPYLLNISEPFTVISTGTWVVAANIGGTDIRMREELDMLFNVNAFSNPVACMRFMGGREWELLYEDESCDSADLDAVLKKEIVVIPSFSEHGGPFRFTKGFIENESQLENGRQRTALTSIYLALMTDYCLDKLESKGAIYLEGSFTQNDLYVALVQKFRPTQRVYTSSDTTGTTLGSAILALEMRGLVTPKFSPAPTLSIIDQVDLFNYRELWLQQIGA